MHTHATQHLAEYLVDLCFEALPAEVVEKAKICLMDSLGCFFRRTSDQYRKNSGKALVGRLFRSRHRAVPGSLRAGISLCNLGQRP